MHENTYYSFSNYLKNHYSFPVYKATIDAGFICPNMDGTKSVGGCTFCNNASFSPAFMVRNSSILEQIDKSILRFSAQRKKLASRNPHFIAYFQAFSGTYGPVEIIKEWYETALSHPRIIGLSISTRADCFSPPIFDLLKDLAANHKEIWVELGVESTHNETLQRINRGHTFNEVEVTVKELQKIPHLKICLHLIHGLPYETTEMMLDSVKKVNALNPTAVKFHHLEIVKDTVMEKQYNNGEITLLTIKEYFDILGKSLRLLNKNIIIQRLFSFSPEIYLVAPLWDKSLQQLFYQYVVDNKIIQGSLL